MAQPLNTHLQDSQWDTLDNNSLMPSISHSRHWLAPMFEHLNIKGTRLISARTSTANNGSLQAITALTKSTLPGNLTLPIARTWDNGFLFSGTPLLSRNNPQAAITALLSGARQELGAKVVLLKKVQHNDQFESLLAQLSPETIAGHHLFNIHERAALFCTGVFETWFNENFSRKRRKEYRRLRNRLADIATLQSQTWQSDEPVEQWIEEFIQLEAAGWKGDNGTAIACSKEQSAHLRHSLSQMAKNGSLLFWKITLKDKPIASLFAFQQQDQVWLGKIAYDETLSHFSPGVLVILDATKDLFARKDVSVADSSADADHPMINNIWRDRLVIADYLIATPGTARVTFKALITIEKAWLNFRNIAKKAYHKLRKGLKK